MKQFGFDYMMNNLKGKSGKGRDAKLATPRGRSTTQFKLPVAVSNKKVSPVDYSYRVLILYQILVLDGNGVVGRTVSAALDEYGVDLITAVSTDSLSGCVMLLKLFHDIEANSSRLTATETRTLSSTSNTTMRSPSNDCSEVSMW